MVGISDIVPKVWSFYRVCELCIQTTMTTMTATKHVCIGSFSLSSNEPMKNDTTVVQPSCTETRRCSGITCNTCFVWWILLLYVHMYWDDSCSFLTVIYFPLVELYCSALYLCWMNQTHFPLPMLMPLWCTENGVIPKEKIKNMKI